MFRHKAWCLAWEMPPSAALPAPGPGILFPASALARKGAYEMRRLATELSLKLVIAGRATEAPGFWQGVETEFADPDPLTGIGLVVYPAYVEHQPRLLLRALAAGIPADVVEDVSILSRKDGENYFEFIMRIVMSGRNRVVRVKVADLDDNMADFNAAKARPVDYQRMDKYRLARRVLLRG